MYQTGCKLTAQCSDRRFIRILHLFTIRRQLVENFMCVSHIGILSARLSSDSIMWRCMVGIHSWELWIYHSIFHIGNAPLCCHFSRDQLMICFIYELLSHHKYINPRQHCLCPLQIYSSVVRISRARSSIAVARTQEQSDRSSSVPLCDLE